MCMFWEEGTVFHLYLYFDVCAGTREEKVKDNRIENGLIASKFTGQFSLV